MGTLRSINPYTLKEISAVPELNEQELDLKLESSFEAFLEYRKTGFTFRKERMLKAAEILRSDARELGGIITSEMGKLLHEAEAEVKKCAWACEYYAENAETFLQGRIIDTDATVSNVICQPLGPLLAVMPWNFPFWQVFRFAAPAIMAGNTALLKHASNVQGCSAAIERIFLEAGFSPGVFQHLTIGASMVEYVIASEKVRAVTLTGSEAAGSAVASLAGLYLKKCVLELGGNNAFVVLKDADLDLAVKIAVVARMQNMGQSCIAAKRFILEEGIYEPFLLKLKDALVELKPGDPMKEGTGIAPLFSPNQSFEVDNQVGQSVGMGAKLIYGGVRNEAFYSPAIVTGVIPGMPLFDDETFGPVFAVSRAKDREEALALSNNSTFGLGMQLFTGSDESAGFFIDGAEEGAVFINGMVKSDPRLPFGGVKRSGFGRELSREGMLEFVNIKTVWKK